MALTKVSYSMIDSAPISVLDYGAVGDGVNNDGPAVQLAINAVNAAGGGAIVFPAGKTYLINTQVNVCDDLVVLGYGAKIVCGTAWKGVSNPMFKNFQGSAFTAPGVRTASKNVSFYGLEFDGGDTGIAGSTILTANMHGVMICMGGWTASSGIKGFIVQDCYFHDFAGDGVMGWKTSDINVSNNRFENFFANDALAIGCGVDFHEVEGCLVSGNTFDHTSTGLSWHGMVVLDWDAGSKNVNISNNIIRNMNNGDGISCEANTPGGTNMDGGVIDGNVIENCDGDGVHITGCAEVIVSNNIIRGVSTTALSSGTGIWCTDTVSAVIDGNSITNGYSTGVFSSGGELLRLVITNNIVIGMFYDNVNFQGDGIFVYDTPIIDSQYIFIGSNYIKDLDGAGIVCDVPAIVSDNFVYNCSRSASSTTRAGIKSLGTIVNNKVFGVLSNSDYGISAGDNQTVSGNSVNGVFAGGKYLAAPRKSVGSSTNYLDYGKFECDMTTQNVTVWDSAAPVSVATYWTVGDIVYNTAPTSGGNIGWVCVAAGLPGTWKAFGTIA